MVMQIKRQILKMIERIYLVLKSTMQTPDALAVAICYHANQIKLLIKD